MLHYIELKPKKTPKLTMIWLHGLGATNQDLVPVAEAIAKSHETPLRFIFPQAPVRPITVNGHMPMPAWFDISEFTLENRLDAKGLEQSRIALEELITAEINNGTLPEQIMLCGFSQGGALALYTGLCAKNNFKALAGFSTFLPRADALHDKLNQSARYRIFLSHGLFDDLLKVEWARMGAEYLKKLKHDVHWNEYPVGHEIPPAAIQDFNRWIEKTIS